MSYNNTIPTITFDNCFQFLKKEENFQNTYCQFCKQIGNSKYTDKIYAMPNYLIIILNRGKGNIFNCNVQILERFCPSNYVENNKYNYFNLIGVVSHFGESGMGGHFIAFCRHNIDGKWRCYNDSIVTECPNDYLRKGTPYILFYQKEEINISNNIISNTINTNNIINGQNNNMNNGQQMNIFYNNNNYQNMNNIFQPNFNINNFYQQNNNMNMNINGFNYNNNFGNNLNNNNFQINYNQNINNNCNNINNYQQNFIINNNY